MMNYSYWELKEWFVNVDFTIVGSGIVGLNCALTLKKKYPKAKILIVEKGMLPQGASSKNAGFACFGSLSELVDDLKSHKEEEVFELVKKRWEGLQLLRRNIGDAAMDYQQNNGYELFLDTALFEKCAEQLDAVNRLIYPLFQKEVFKVDANIFGFKKMHDRYITNTLEGQIDTGKMITHLLDKVTSLGIRIVNGIHVEEFTEIAGGVQIETNRISFVTNKLCIATNGFARKLIDETVKPARAQVLVTKPIPGLKIQGTFHLDKGYYYFRNIDSRILLGGGRNLDFEGEETTSFAQTELIQNRLEELLSAHILADTTFEIAHRWSGIMGVGKQKKAIVKQLSNHVFCGVRLGGMGVAIGSLIGEELAELLCD